MIVITLLEACVASVLVFALTYFILGLDLAFCAVLAALASATAPASTVMTIRQTGAKGDFCGDAAADCGARRRGEPGCLQHRHLHCACR